MNKYSIEFSIADFLSRVEPDPVSKCWNWVGFCNKDDNYGRFSISNEKGRIQVLAHRLSYSYFVSLPDENMAIDHKCRNRRCVNPEHLREVTHAVNALENSVGVTAKNAMKTHCNYGHELTEENLYKVNCRKERRCIACHKGRIQKRRADARSSNT